jgi:anti-anti-sigma factor
MEQRNLEIPRNPSRSTTAVERVGDVWIASTRDGSLDDRWLHQLADDLLALIRDHACRKLVISLGDIECLYSTLLAKLMTVQRAMAAQQGRIKLCDLSPHVREVFHVAKLDSFFEFAEDRNSAIRDW